MGSGSSLAKFYVSCRKFNAVVMAEQPDDAVIKAFSRLRDKEKLPLLTSQVVCSEKGFKYHDGDAIFITEQVLAASGLREKYVKRRTR